MTTQNHIQSQGHFTVEALLTMRPRHVQFHVQMVRQKFAQRMKLASLTHLARTKNHSFVESLGKMLPNPVPSLVKPMMTVRLVNAMVTPLVQERKRFTVENHLRMLRQNVASPALLETMMTAKKEQSVSNTLHARMILMRQLILTAPNQPQVQFLLSA
jgi:hypothetical protein